MDPLTNTLKNTDSKFQFIVESGKFTENDPLHKIIKTGITKKTITLLKPPRSEGKVIIRNISIVRKGRLSWVFVWLRRF